MASQDGTQAGLQQRSVGPVVIRPRLSEMSSEVWRSLRNLLRKTQLCQGLSNRRKCRQAMQPLRLGRLCTPVASADAEWHEVANQRAKQHDAYCHLRNSSKSTFEMFPVCLLLS